MIIKIKRNGYENTLTEEQKEHESEQQIKKIDADFKFSCGDLNELGIAAEFIRDVIAERWRV